MAGALTRDTVSWLLALSTPSHCMPSDTTRAMPPVDIQLLLDALLRHGVMPLAVDQVHRFPELTALQEPLRAAQAANAGRALASVAHIAATAAAFDAAGIPWCVLKGVPLALRHYGDLAARQVGDIDILAPPGDTAAADDALRRGGWKRQGTPQDTPLPPPRYWHEQRYVGPTGLILELHHRLHPNPHLLDVRTDELLARTDTVKLGTVPVPVLDRVTELLYLSTHGCRHGWFRLLWVCDIAAVTQTASPEFLETTRQAAARLGVLFPLAQALSLADQLLGATAPSWAHASHTRFSRQRRLIAFALETLWCARDADGNPTQRTRSSLLTALSQRAGLRFWAWELLLRVRHEHQTRLAQT